MRLEIHNRCADFASYRAARVKSLFNAESGCNFDLVAELPLEGVDWKIGVVVGPSGSGKSSLGRAMFGPGALYDPTDWPEDRPIIDAIAPEGDFNAVTGALAAVGLGDVPAWLRPFGVLSNGERFRANLARLVCEAPGEVVVDEFTSVVDRQIARIGALAFQKAWRRTGGKVVLLSCHYDILDWLEPDWVFDTATCEFTGGRLRRRPEIPLEIWRTDWRYWPVFEPHHYLKAPRMVAAQCYVGAVDGRPVAHVAVSPKLEVGGMRACRLVILPEWQGAGIGVRFLDAVCEHELTAGRFLGRARAVYFHTSRPGLAAVLRRRPRWRQITAILYGGHKGRSAESIKASRKRAGSGKTGGTGYGGHFRAVQGFKFTLE